VRKGGRLSHGMGEELKALEYFEKARSLYSQWGSPVKTERLSSYVTNDSLGEIGTQLNLALCLE
jgi:hypothetical protein